MNSENEHDFTKLMLETIRAKSSKHIRFINENEGGGAVGVGGDTGGGFESDTTQTPTSGGDTSFEEEEIDVDTDVENEEDGEEQEDNGLDSPEAKEEISKMGETVNNLVKVKRFKIYEDSGNVVMSGNLQNAELDWQFSKDDGFFIDANNVNLTDELKGILDKLTAYYTNWRDDWAGKIGEYTKKG